jgi:aldose 1-epimerase
LAYLSPDGEMGFPGNLAVKVRYTLNNNNELGIHYTAVTDQQTIVSLTNHSYFNLAGAGSGTVVDQIAWIDADNFTAVKEGLIPTGQSKEVKGTPLDFRTPIAIGAHIQDKDAQLQYAEPNHGGYDHNWILNHAGDLTVAATRFTDPKSGRTIEMYTTEPGVQFYSGNFLDGSFTGPSGRPYREGDGFALETQHFPDSPNQPGFPSAVLRPGTTYRSSTCYTFSAAGPASAGPASAGRPVRAKASAAAMQASGTAGIT